MSGSVWPYGRLNLWSLPVRTHQRRAHLRLQEFLHIRGIVNVSRPQLPSTLETLRSLDRHALRGKVSHLVLRTFSDQDMELQLMTCVVIDCIGLQSRLKVTFLSIGRLNCFPSGGKFLSVCTLAMLHAEQSIQIIRAFRMVPVPFCSFPVVRQPFFHRVAHLYRKFIRARSLC